MVVLFHFVVLMLSLIMLGSFLLRNKNIDTLFVLFSIMVAINCLGRYMLVTSQTLEMALWATRFLYIGGCYAPMLVVFVLARLCNHKIPLILRIVMITYSTVVMSLVLTVGRTAIYYKSVELAYRNGYSYLIKSYGPMHALYPTMLIMYGIIMLIYILYTVKNRNHISFRLVLTLSTCCFLIIALYIFERIVKSDISIMSIGYLVGVSLLINYFDRINMYDMSSNLVNNIDKLKEYGYIVFDDKYRYITANNYLKELFPEIKEWTVDKVVGECDSFFYNEVIRYLYNRGTHNGYTPDSRISGRNVSEESMGDENISDSQVKTIQSGDVFLDFTIREIIVHKKTKKGYLLEFIDRTLEKKYYTTMEDYNVRLKREVDEKTSDILYIKDMLVLGMADMVESRDNNTGGHIKRTSAVIKIFARRLREYNDELGISDEFLSMVEKAAPMHDLGKIAIDDVILRKPGKYTDEEFAVMKGHAKKGAEIVANILKGVESDEFVTLATNVAHYHHEKWNGKGYPSGRSGVEIPLEARIMALADVFDALVSKRCYKEAFSYDEAFKIIEESLGEHFDPVLGKIFITCRSELEQLYNNGE